MESRAVGSSDGGGRTEGVADGTSVGDKVGTYDGIPVGARDVRKAAEGREVGDSVSMLKPDSKISTIPIRSSSSVSVFLLVSCKSLRVPAGSDFACFQKSPRLKMLDRAPRRAAR